jgi:hypothetical protein
VTSLTLIVIIANVGFARSADRQWEKRPAITHVDQLKWEDVQARAEEIINGCRPDTMGDFFAFASQGGQGQPYDLNFWCRPGEGKLGKVSVVVVPFDSSFENNYLRLVGDREATSIGFYYGSPRSAVYLAFH